MATQEFYESCKSHLQNGGVAVNNLVETDFLFKEKVNTFVRSFNTVFDYTIKGVHVLFGSDWKNINLQKFLKRARKLDNEYCFAFPFFANAKKVKVVKFDDRVFEEYSNAGILTDKAIP